MARKKLQHKSGTPYILSGLLLILIFLGWRYHQVRILSFNARELSKVETSGIVPVYIKAYPVGVDVEVEEATINNGVWAIHPDSVSHLNTSAGIGDTGNIIMYGHNKDSVLGPIRYTQVGQKIEIKGSDNKDYNYEIIKIDVVSPDNLEYIKDTETETLTIYTCVGFLDSKRFIVVAKRI